jgi:hypothetical protein
MLAADPARCALNNTVVAAPLPPADVQVILPLAASALAAGFPCIVALPFEPVALPPGGGGVVALQPPVQLLLPRSRWCNKSRGEYIKRRTQFYRLRLWSTLLHRGLDVLGVDPSHRLRRNPIPAIHALRTREDAQYGNGQRPDVLGSTPGWFLKEYYLHSMWIRSTPTTRALLARVEARARGVYDQTAFSEELNWGAGANASCCHTACLSAQLTTSRRQPNKGVSPIITEECKFDDNPPLAPPPPNATRHVWLRTPWRPDAYNDLKIPFHRFGRCTGRDVSCAPEATHASCPPSPPPFTQAIAIADRKKAAAQAKARRHVQDGRVKREKRALHAVVSASGEL